MDQTKMVFIPCPYCMDDDEVPSVLDVAVLDADPCPFCTGGRIFRPGLYMNSKTKSVCRVTAVVGFTFNLEDSVIYHELETPLANLVESDLDVFEIWEPFDYCETCADIEEEIEKDERMQESLDADLDVSKIKFN